MELLAACAGGWGGIHGVRGFGVEGEWMFAGQDRLAHSASLGGVPVVTASEPVAASGSFALRGGAEASELLAAVPGDTGSSQGGNSTTAENVEEAGCAALLSLLVSS